MLEFIALLLAPVATPPVPPPPVAAVPESLASALDGRAQQVPDLINGKIQPADVLFVGWEQKIPPAQWEKIRSVMVERLGPALKVVEVEKASATEGRVTVLFEKGKMPFLIAIEDKAPHRVASFKMDR